MAEEKPLGLKIASGILAFVGVLTLVVAILMLILTLLMPMTINQTLAVPTTYEDSAAGQSATLTAMNELLAATELMLTITIIIAALTGIVYLIVAYCLWKMNKIAMYAATVLSVMGLLSFPLGTVLHGIVLYFLWFDNKTKALFAQKVEKPASG